MTITRVHGGPGWSANEKLTSAQMTAVDLNATFALDKRSGQTDTLASAVTVSSAGSVLLANGSHLTAQSGALVTLQGGSELDLNGLAQLQGTLNLLGGSFTEVQSGAEVHFDAGSSLTGTVAVTSGSLSLQTGVNFTGASGSHFTMQAGSVTTWGGPVTMSGALLTVNGASEIAFSAGGLISGSPKLKTGSLFQVDATATIFFDASSFLIADVGSSVTFNGAAALTGATSISGALAVTGATTLSGSGATVAKRRGPVVALTGATTFDIRAKNVWQCDPAITGNLVIIPTVGAFTDGIEVTINRYPNPATGALANHTVQVQDGVGNVHVTWTGSGVGATGFIRLTYNAGRGAWDAAETATA